VDPDAAFEVIPRYRQPPQSLPEVREVLFLPDSADQEIGEGDDEGECITDTVKKIHRNDEYELEDS